MELCEISQWNEVARQNVRKLERALHRALEQAWKLNQRIEDSYNAYWGMLLKARGEQSIFGSQVEDYACVYTSRVTNFGLYSSFQYFRSRRDRMSHEQHFPDNAD